MRWIWQYGKGDRASCADQPDPRPEHCPDEDAEYANLTLDLSQWDGVSLWARRGPDSQPGIRVLVGDKHVDDDTSYVSYRRHTEDELLEPEAEEELEWNYPKRRYCERHRECDCRNHKPCTWFTDPLFSDHDEFVEPPPGGFPEGDDSGHYCWDPEVDPPPGTLDECGRPIEYDRCGRTQCEQHHPPWPEHVTDAQFTGRPCSTYAFENGIEGKYCYRPGVDPDPVHNEDLCGDYWFAPVRLTKDWTLHLVPFTDMHQQGWAMESWHLDLSAISVVRLTFDRGWIDYWIDDVSFYRRVDR
jgi:hypothetical protein